MPSSYTPSLRLTLPVTGELSGQWGTTVNNGITELLDSAVAGTATISTWGGAGVAYTLTSANGAADEARKMFIVATGAPGEAKNVICPAVSKLYVFRNNTTGGFALTLKTSGGTGIAVAAGQAKLLYCDGTNVVEAVNALGPLANLTASQAVFTDASKNLVSNAITGTGNVVMSASPTLTGTVGAASLTLSSLTSGRVTYAGASGLLQDSANLTFNGTDLTVSGAVNAGSVNATTLDLTNLEVTNIKAKDGTASASIADSTGVMSLVANPVFSGGTANGVLYLNGSKVATSGSALTFNGTNLGVGVASPSYGVDIRGTSGVGIQIYETSTGNDNRLIITQQATVSTYNSTYGTGSGAHAWQVGNAEQMRLTTAGLGIGTSSPANKLTVDGNANITGNVTLGDASTDTVTVNGYMGVNGGGANNSVGVRVGGSLSNTAQRAFYTDLVGSSAATARVTGFEAAVGTAASAFTLPVMAGFYAANGTLGAGSTITNQYGVYINDQTVGTNNYGIASLVSSGTNKWNIYASGTAQNYFAGAIQVGSPVVAPTYLLDVNSSSTTTAIRSLGSGTSGLDTRLIVGSAGNGGAGRGVAVSLQPSGSANSVEAVRLVGLQESASATANNASFTVQVANTSGTLTERMRIDSSGNVGIGTSSPTNTLSVSGSANVTGNVTLGDASTDTVQVNGYMGVGGAGDASIGLNVRSTQLTGTGQSGVYSQPTASSAATTSIAGYNTYIGTAAATFTVADLYGFRFAGVNKGAGSTITNIHGLYIADQTQGTNNYGITSLVSSGSNKWNIYASGTAANYFAGNVGIGTSAPVAKVQTLISGTAVTNGADTPSGVFVEGPESASGNLQVVVNDSQAAGNGGSIAFGAKHSGNNFAYMGLIKSGKDNSTSGNFAGYLSLSTRPSGGVLTERMRLDASGNLGLGVTPSAWNAALAIQVGPTGSFSAGVSGNFGAVLGNNLVTTSSGYGANYITSAFASMYTQLRSDGSHRWYNAPSGTAGNAITFTQAMTLDASGNLGIGTSSPAVGLHLSSATNPVTGSAQRYNVFINDSTALAAGIGGGVIFSGVVDGTTAQVGFGGIQGIKENATSGNSASALIFTTRPNAGNLTERLRIDSSGNLGLGVTPSAWASGWRALQTLGGNTFYTDSTISALGSNAIYDGAWKYVSTAGAGTYQVNRGVHNWFTAPSGTAGTAITFTQAMTLNASSQLLVGTTTNTNSSTVVSGGTVSETVSGTQYLVASQFDIGTAPNEIPLNQYLGTMAYQDSTSVVVSSLNVGIVTSPPVRPLEVAGTPVLFGSAQSVIRAADTRAMAQGVGGGIVFTGNATTGQTDALTNFAAIHAAKANATSADTSGNLIFSTRLSGSDIAERARIDSSGNLLITSAGGLGYGTGSGGAVTQITSRTTGVTLNKTNGAITLVSAAGSTAWQSFTVTNSTVAATDVIKVCQKSGTDLYLIHVTNVAAGSFRITFATTGGTTTEQPVFNFAVIKAVTA